MLEAVGKAGFSAGEDVYLALDVASSEFWAGSGRYEFKKSGEPARDSEGMVALYDDWCRAVSDHLDRGRLRRRRLARLDRC